MKATHLAISKNGRMHVFYKEEKDEAENNKRKG